MASSISIGKKLKKQRLAKGLDLRDIEEALKIKVGFLKAIEENKFEILPEPVYAKSFVNSYAMFLRINPRPLLDKLRDDYFNSDSFVQIKPISPSFKYDPYGKKKVRNFSTPITIMIIIFSLTGFLAYLGYQDSIQSQKINNNNYVSSEIKKLETSVNKKKSHKKIKNTSIAINSKSNLFKINISINKSTWVRVKAKKKVFFSRYLKKGFSQTFISREPLEIMASRGSYVQIKQDGTDKGLLSQTSSIATKVYKK